jgi:hypothetical protein
VRAGDCSHLDFCLIHRLLEVTVAESVTCVTGREQVTRAAAASLHLYLIQEVFCLPLEDRREQGLKLRQLLG